jgi:CRISPR-associated endonuclease/helicase Cas3
MDQGDRGRLTELVRDVDSVGVIISRDPQSVFAGRVWPRLLSVSGLSLMRLRQHIQMLAPGGWVAKGAVEKNNDERPGIALEWNVLSAEQLRAQWLVAIHPDFASYDPRVGLRLGEAGPPPRPIFQEAPPAQHYEYQFEPWTEHCHRIVAQVRAMFPHYKRAMRLLAVFYGVSEASIAELMEITCALHDVGKLTIEWQQCAWLWQDHKDARARAAGLPVPDRPRVPIAHTWYESAVDRDFRGSAQYRFPPHAVQGAYAVCDAVAARLIALGGEKWGQLAARCAVTAIARHHGPRTRECSLFRFPADARQTLASISPDDSARMTLQECTLPLDREQFPDELLSFLGTESSTMVCDAFPLYTFLVRTLRLADQIATSARPQNEHK